MNLVARIPLTIIPLLLFCGPAVAGYDSFTDIHPAGWTESAALCINARGDVAGYGATAQGERGFVWSGGTVAAILPPGADSARAAWINRSGDIAGTAVTAGVPHAFVLRGGNYLDPTPGWAYSTAVFVGDDGIVAGSGEYGAYISRNGVTEILPGFSAVQGGNLAGELIGTNDNAARLYVPGKGYFDLTPPTAAEAFPNVINESGLVAITSLLGGSEKGFVYSGGWFIQMTPSGWESSRATAINNVAAVVGFGDAPGIRQSFVRNGGDYEFIAFPGWTATEAVSLNDLGQVAGSGLTSSGARHAFVASPSGVSAASASVPGSETPGGGGCAMIPGAAGRATSAGSAVNVAILASPLLLLLGRRVRKQGRPSAPSHSP